MPRTCILYGIGRFQITRTGELTGEMPDFLPLACYAIGQGHSSSALPKIRNDRRWNEQRNPLGITASSSSNCRQGRVRSRDFAQGKLPSEEHQGLELPAATSGEFGASAVLCGARSAITVAYRSAWPAAEPVCRRTTRVSIQIADALIEKPVWLAAFAAFATKILSKRCCSPLKSPIAKAPDSR